MNDDFYFNIWNLSNYEHTVINNHYGRHIQYFLDGMWKVIDLDMAICIAEIPGAIEMCAWLNQWEFKPTGKKVEA